MIYNDMTRHYFTLSPYVGIFSFIKKINPERFLTALVSMWIIYLPCSIFLSKTNLIHTSFFIFFTEIESCRHIFIIFLCSFSLFDYDSSFNQKQKVCSFFQQKLKLITFTQRRCPWIIVCLTLFVNLSSNIWKWLTFCEHADFSAFSQSAFLAFSPHVHVHLTVASPRAIILCILCDTSSEETWKTKQKRREEEKAQLTTWGTCFTEHFFNDRLNQWQICRLPIRSNFTGL